MSYSDLWLSVNAFILDVILIAVFYRQESSGLRQERLFRLLLWNLLALNTIAFSYTVLLKLAFELAAAEWIISWLATIFITLTPMLLLAYLNSLFYYDAAEKRANTFLIILAGLTILSVALFGPVVICQNRTIVLRGTVGMILVVVPAALFLSVGFLQGFLLKKSISRMHLWSLRSIFVICVLALAGFVKFCTLPIYGFVLSLLPLLCLFTLEGKDTLIDQESGLRNFNAFRTSVIVRLENRKAFRLILVYAGGLSSILAGLDEESGRKIIGEFSSSLRGITELTVFRISEEVFAILQDEIDEVVTQELMINLRTEAMSALRYGKRQYYLNLHACVSDLPKDIQTMEDLEITAALLKEAGSLNKGGELMIRNLDVEKEKKMREEVHTLSEALQENRMEVWYQPIMNTETGKFDCAEALIRMKAVDGSYVQPGRFIPAAERSGLIIRIGRFVMQEVCAFLAGNQREELGIKYVEANLSVEECIQETLPAMLKNTLEEYRVSPKLLNIEVTETADDTVSEMMMHNMALIHENIGIDLSLDDFGTGYSNLARVLNMPVSVVKFDRSMLLKAFETEEGRIVFTRLAEAVHNIDRKIVSEGVETKEQADFVKSLGIEYIQGFYYAKPMPKEAYLEFLRAHNGAAS